MPKSSFSVSAVTSLQSIPEGGRIHVIGVCGVAMAQMAIALSRRGYRVSGSDKEFYEPMGGLLEKSSIEICRGYSETNIPEKVDLVVIGNAVSYEHPEVLAIEKRKLPYSFFPQMLFDLIIQGKHSIVISGTHGKSTSTALAATALVKLGLVPSYFIGAAVNELESSLTSSTGNVCAVEGDEYDSAFFAKVPKYTFYRPKTWVVTSIEYDHADIYPDLASIERVFTKQVNELPKEGTLICCIDCVNIRRLLAEWRKTAQCRIVTYGDAPDAEVRLEATSQRGFLQTVKVTQSSAIFKEQGALTFTLPLAGRYNAKNAIAVMLSLLLQGASWQAAAQAVGSFKGLRRRQDILIEDEQIVLIDDFAHHPSAVRETLAGIKSAYPARRIVAIFEPRSNTSRRKVFQDEYVRGFADSGEVILCEVKARTIDQGEQLLDVSELSQAISESGVIARTLPDADSIFNYVKSHKTEGDVIVVMSNGGFGGLVGKLKEALKPTSIR